MMSNRTHEIFIGAVFVDPTEKRLIELITLIQIFSSSHLHQSIRYQVSSEYCCSISRNKLFMRRDTSLNHLDTHDIQSCVDYILNHDHNIIEESFYQMDVTGLRKEIYYLYQEEKNESKFVTRVTSEVLGNIEMLLSKLNFENELLTKRRSVVVSIETAEKVVVNIIKGYNEDGTHVMKIELINSVVDGIHGHESYSKLKSVAEQLANYINLT